MEDVAIRTEIVEKALYDLVLEHQTQLPNDNSKFNYKKGNTQYYIAVCKDCPIPINKRTVIVTRGQRLEGKRCVDCHVAYLEKIKKETVILPSSAAAPPTSQSSDQP